LWFYATDDAPWSPQPGFVENHSGKPLKFSACNPDFSQQASSAVKILACGCISGSSFSEPAGTIKDVLVLFMNGTAEPHVVQKDFENSLDGCS